MIDIQISFRLYLAVALYSSPYISPLMYSYLLVGSSRLVVVNEAKCDQRNFLFVCGDQIHTAIRRISHGKPSSFFICLFPMPTMRQTLVRWRCGLLAAGCRPPVPVPASGAVCFCCCWVARRCQTQHAGTRQEAVDGSVQVEPGQRVVNLNARASLLARSHSWPDETET